MIHVAASLSLSPPVRCRRAFFLRLTMTNRTHMTEDNKPRPPRFDSWRAYLLQFEWHPVCLALSAGDLPVVMRFVREMYDMEIDEDVARWLCATWQAWPVREDGYQWNTAAAPAVWLKTRLSEHGAWPTAGMTPGDEMPPQNHLHCFFIHILESAEMLARLRNERKSKPSVARSRVSKSVKKIKPIDGTAARVSDWPLEPPK